MQLPQYKRNRRQKEKYKICHEPGCGKEFWGHPIAKYCELHNDPKKRVRRRRRVTNIRDENMVFEHRFSEVTSVEFPCALKGCCKKFIVKVFPKQYVYPKYCEEHRVIYRRGLFLRKSQKSHS